MFGPGFDPSKLKPETIGKMTQLLQELTPQQMQKMQSLMHNSMAGFDIKKDMDEFERGLPPSFREKMARIMYEAHGVIQPESGGTIDAVSGRGSAGSVSLSGVTADSEAVPMDLQPPQNIREARMTILSGIAAGQMPVEQAYEILFPGE